MRCAPLALLNGAVPGSGLAVRGRLATGLALLLFSLAALTVLLLADLLATPAFARSLRLAAAIGYLGLALLASFAWYLWERRRRWQSERIISLHRDAAAAYLAGDLSRALDGARALARSAADLPGAWLFLATVASAAGDTALERRAHRRHQRLLAR